MTGQELREYCQESAISYVDLMKALEVSERTVFRWYGAEKVTAVVERAVMHVVQAAKRVRGQS